MTYFQRMVLVWGRFRTSLGWSWTLSDCQRNHKISNFLVKGEEVGEDCETLLELQTNETGLAQIPHKMTIPHNRQHFQKPVS